MAAEYILSEGNYESTVRTRGTHLCRSHADTLDLSIVPAVQRLSHLPIIVDPSHGNATSPAPCHAPQWPWAQMESWWKFTTIPSMHTLMEPSPSSLISLTR